MHEIFLAAALALALATPALAAPACGPEADMVDPRCYGAAIDDNHDDAPAVQQAISVAIATDRPLYLSHGTYRLGHEVEIDYAASAGRGFDLIAHGAVLDGNTIAHGPTLAVDCSGGTSAAPKGCFYFHQEGTLFVDAHSGDWAVEIGKPDFSDAQNSIRIDHLIVNNGGVGAIRLSYVLDSDLFIVADAGVVGMYLSQVQFSTLRGAASGAQYSALLFGPGYNFGNVIEAEDLEASPRCITVWAGHTATNTVEGGTMNCPVALDDPQQRIAVSGVGFGGAVREGMP